MSAALSNMKPAPDVVHFTLPAQAEATKYISDIAHKLVSMKALSVRACSRSELDADLAALVVLCRGDVRACLATLQVLVNKTQGSAAEVVEFPNTDTDLRSCFYSWLVTTGRDELVLSDTFRDIFEMSESGSTEKVSLVADAVIDTAFYDSPVVQSITPVKINPYCSNVLHIKGRNFLQRCIHAGQVGITINAEQVEIAPVSVWLCGQQFEAQPVSDELIVVELPRLMEDDTAKNDQFKPQDWRYFGSQPISIHVGISQGYHASSDAIHLSREYLRYAAASRPEYACLVSSMSIDSGACSRTSWVTFVDPYSIRKKTAMAIAATTLAPLFGRKRQKRSTSVDLTLSNDIEVSAVYDTTDNNDVKDGTPVATDTVLAEVTKPPLMPKAQPPLKRGRRNIIAEDDDEGGANSSPAQQIAENEKHSAISDEVVLGDIFDEDTDIMDSNRIRKGVQEASIVDLRELACKVIDDCLADPESKPFSEPVDRQRYPEYFEVIKRPMDLGTVRELLLEGGYDIQATKRRAKKLRKSTEAEISPTEGSQTVDIDSIWQDIRLVWNNCLTFNDPESELAAMADKMSMLFETILQRQETLFEEVFSWVYRAPPRMKRRSSSSKKRSLKPKNGDFIDEDADEEEMEAEWLDEPDNGVSGSRLAALSDGTEDNVPTLELDIIDMPSFEELCARLISASENRSQKYKAVNDTLQSDPRNATSEYNARDGLKDLRSKYSMDQSLVGYDAVGELFDLADLAASRSDAELLNSAFALHGVMQNPFNVVSDSYGFVDGPPMCPANSDEIADEARSREPDGPTTNGGLSGFFSLAGANPAANTGIAGASDSSLAIEESLWSEHGFHSNNMARFGNPINSGVSIYSAATPFSGIAWRQGWAGLNALAVSVFALSGKIYLTKRGDKKISVSYERNAHRIGTFDQIGCYEHQADLLRTVSNFLPLSESSVNIHTSCVLSNKTSQWALNREFSLDGWPFLRSMLQAESQISEDGKAYTGVHRFTPDGEDISNKALFADSVFRTSTRQSISRKYVSRYQHISKLTTNKSEEALRDFAAIVSLEYNSGF